MSLTMTYRVACFLACLSASFVAAPAMAKACDPLAAGSSQIVFSGWSGPKLPVFVHKPQTAGADSRIVFVMHDVQRDGERYRDEWRDLAEQHNLIVVVPTFGREDFPTTGSYNLGNIIDKKGRKTPKAEWSFSAIEPLFDDIVCRVSGNQRGYALYGHSAGGQFVHRYVAFADAPRMDSAVAANSGWYTMPDDRAFPYGWGGDVAGLVSPAKAFQRPLTILLGTEDIDRKDPNLRVNGQADKQGQTRFDRGHSFLAAAHKRAGVAMPISWKIAYAPGVGHDNGQMAPFAIPHLLGAAARAPSPQVAVKAQADIEKLRSRKAVTAAMATIIELESDWAIQRLVELTEIPAPPFEEEKRGLAFARMLREIGGLDVRIDEIGNVIARRKGTGTGSAVMLAAHLDTVFAKDVDVTVKRDGDRFTAPGIGDNSRGLVSLLLVARALERHAIYTERDILFVGTVGEEGTGDLRGMRHIFSKPDHAIGSVIAIDGGEMGRLIDTAVGSNRYRVKFTGPGGHSYGAFGTVNPHHATARAITRFLDRAEPVTASGSKATYSVALLEGGLGINVIPTDSAFEIDLRSSDANRLAALDAILRSAIGATLASENAGKKQGGLLAVEIKDLGKRPAGTNAANAPLVSNAEAALSSLGVEPSRNASSTDANLPMSLGIPSITISRGGISERSHSNDEYWIAKDPHFGPQAALLISLLEAAVSNDIGDAR
ncbi:acetylornithine deacetylase/succinyl-diaminopimelate desuccinylase-like protein/poly(3-hydroxybutyrate) depolymerase [Sphingorhabdus rigui]|uniref:Acetylornithine deacetylase/succinyl-diaminopimelate desuccinylase-like protein/poly(3-hydroxybutyrate) depolymerase n=1 Tax=Sphingorhabdus rigui TaxID=1282858 RepID=A0A840B3I0_9SPHN|nr:M20/M25/M40 family metallo-hydrolase [Sphingorhabdus rigui]MBB3943842.1 acetylornithine deacetylase/succinyl-diaminopimelate desuccinylase-like protein/poly(3-hydroxybutyrate) depolymerase [Sphingorhabdus rigui]